MERSALNPANPTTVSGDELLTLVPSPSWPSSFEPQHFSADPDMAAQVWFHPNATAVTPLPSSGTYTDTLLAGGAVAQASEAIGTPTLEAATGR